MPTKIKIPQVVVNQITKQSRVDLTGIAIHHDGIFIDIDAEWLAKHPNTVSFNYKIDAIINNVTYESAEYVSNEEYNRIVELYNHALGEIDSFQKLNSQLQHSISKLNEQCQTADDKSITKFFSKWFKK